MSESVSSGQASSTQSASQGSASPQGSAGPSYQTPSASTNGEAKGAGPNQTLAAERTPPQGAPQEQSQTQERILAEQDLDAYIEHTINGRKEKVKIRDLTKAYGLDKAANQRMQEAAAERKRTQQLMHLMETDPKRYCEVTGKDYGQWARTHLSGNKELAEEILAREYEIAQMDPHQRKSLELEQELRAFKEREMSVKKPLIDQIKEIVPADRLPRGLENATEAQLKEYLSARQTEFQQGVDNLSNELLDAWQKSGLPKEKDFGAWMAQVMFDHSKKSSEHKKRTGEELPPLQPHEAAAKVKTRFLNSTRSLLSQMDASAIQEMLGEAIIQKLRDHDIGIASRQNGPKFDNQNRPAPAASEPKKQMNQTEWRKAMGIS